MIRLDPLFKGCTRPAMYLGVPIVPLFIVVSIFMLLSVLLNFWLLILMLPVLFFMKQFCALDDQIFRLVNLHLWLRFQHWVGNYRFWANSCCYSPIAFEKRGVFK